eukprot:1158472-Pelagomonas_calceolata.AAC.6
MLLPPWASVWLSADAATPTKIFTGAAPKLSSWTCSTQGCTAMSQALYWEGLIVLYMLASSCADQLHASQSHACRRGMPALCSLRLSCPRGQVQLCNTFLSFLWAPTAPYWRLERGARVQLGYPPST